MEGLPHDFYMTNYIKDISEWRNNISEGEYNKSRIEYLPKLQYFNTTFRGLNHKKDSKQL